MYSRKGFIGGTVSLRYRTLDGCYATYLQATKAQATDLERITHDLEDLLCVNNPARIEQLGLVFL
jgi:hypothetical protein